MTLRRKDGSTFEAEVSSGLFTDAGGITRTSMVIRDITERKKAEEAIRKSEQVYRTMFDNSDDGFVLLEPIYNQSGNVHDLKFLRVNPAYERQTGTTTASIEGKTARKSAGDLELEWVSIISRVVKLGESVRYESFNRRTSRWYDAHFFPFAEGTVGVLFRDITERKKAEEALTESEKRYHQLFDSMTEMFFIADLVSDKKGEIVDFIYVDANLAFLKYLNKNKSQIIGKKQTELFKISENQLLMDILTHKNISAQPRRITVKNGLTDRYLEVLIWKVSKNQVGCSFIDITDRKLLEKQLQDNERLAAIGQTAGMVGHDLRNPLQSVVGELYLAKSELDEMPRGQREIALRESIDSVETQVSYMDKIVSDLQTFVKPVQTSKEKVNLNELFASTLEQINVPENIQAKIRLKNKLTIDADPQLLRRVLINLITNSIQAMPNGGKLIIKAYECKGQIKIEVEDTGVGIPEEIKPKIFAPLFTTKSRGQGFGLSVCKRVIEKNCWSGLTC